MCVRCNTDLEEISDNPYRSVIFRVLAISGSGFLGLVVGGSLSDLLGQHILGYLGLGLGIVIGTRLISKDRWYIGIVALFVLLAIIFVLGFLILLIGSLGNITPQ